MFQTAFALPVPLLTCSPSVSVLLMRCRAFFWLTACIQYLLDSSRADQRLDFVAVERPERQYARQVVVVFERAAGLLLGFAFVGLTCLFPSSSVAAADLAADVASLVFEVLVEALELVTLQKETDFVIIFDAVVVLRKSQQLLLDRICVLVFRST